MIHVGCQKGRLVGWTTIIAKVHVMAYPVTQNETQFITV